MTSVRRGKHGPPEDQQDPTGTPRRRFLGYLLAGPTLAVAAAVGTDAVLGEDGAAAVVDSPPEVSDLTDLGDILTLAAVSTRRSRASAAATRTGW